MPVNVSSTLMHNHVPARRFADQTGLAVVQAADGSQILFALDYKGRMTVTQRTDQETSGWAQTDLTARLGGVGGLGAAPYVQCFAASQDADGSIWLVIAAANDPTYPSTVLVSRALSNALAPADWSGFGTWLTRRDIPKDSKVEQLVIGTADDGAGTPAIVASATRYKMAEDYMINSNASDPTWSWLLVPLPQDAKESKAVASGNMPGLGRGVYTYYVTHPEYQVGGAGLNFTTLPVMEKGKLVTKNRALKLPDQFGSHAMVSLATLPVSNGETELYLSGGGLYRYTLSEQRDGGLGLPIEIADKALIHTTPQLAVSADADASRVDVWTINGFKQLVHTTGTVIDSAEADRAQGDAADGSGARGDVLYRWQPPLVMDLEVTSLAAYRVAAADGGTEAALATAGADFLALKTKQDATELWQTQNIALPAPDAALELYTYTTRVEITDDEGVAVENKPVAIRPATDVPALVNGKYYALTATVAKSARTDEDGTVTIVVETTDLVAPEYHLVIEGEDVQPEDPADDVKTLLRGVTRADDIAQAQRSDGGLLFPNMNDELHKQCGYATVGIQRLMKVYDDGVAAGAVPGGSGGQDGVRARDPFIAIYYRYTVDGGYELLEGESALAALPDRGLWHFVKSAGDLIWSGLKAAANQVVEWAVHAAEGFYEFAMKIGERVFAFVFKLASQAISAIDFVLKATLGLTLRDIIAWLGFLFNWSDVRKNHRVLAHMFDLGFKHTIDHAPVFAREVNQLITQTRESLVDNRIPVPTTAAVFDDRVRSAPESEPAASSPQGDWATRQLRDNGSSAKVALVPLSDPGKFSGLEQSAVLQHVVSGYQDEIVEAFTHLDYRRFVDVFLPLVGDVALTKLQEVADILMKGLVPIIESLQKLATARWDIPVITWIYENVICQGDGSQLTMLDVVALVTAIPATLAAKAASGSNLFSDSVANAVLAAKTWNQMMAALCAPAEAGPGGQPGQAGQDVSTLDHAARLVLAARAWAAFPP
jgi:hypothetical protein